MKAVFERFLPSGMGFNIIHWTPSGFAPLSGEQYAVAMEEVFLTALENGIFVDQIARRISPLVTGRYRHTDCSAMGGKIVFHPDGRVSNCISSRCMNDWSGRIPVLMDQCLGCHAAGICGGGCAWDAIHLGRDGGPDPRHCVWVKRILDLFLGDVQHHFGPGRVSRESLQGRYGALISRGSSTLNSSIGHGE
jgi:radical SAM protein with 4Fe4S-binding SPASM domain